MTIGTASGQARKAVARRIVLAAALGLLHIGPAGTAVAADDAPAAPPRVEPSRATPSAAAPETAAPAVPMVGCTLPPWPDAATDREAHLAQVRAFLLCQQDQSGLEAQLPGAPRSRGRR